MHEIVNPVLDVVGLVKEYPVGNRFFGTGSDQSIKAVSDVNFSVGAGQTFGLVGESGCGKTTLGRCILRLMEPTQGQVYLDGSNILLAGQEEMRALRKDIQIVFQDPMASLHPKMTVGRILAEGLRLAKLPPEALKGRITELIDLVKLPADVVDRYPHELSGGQRQRIGIARAVSLNPKVIVLDEPVSSLDVSIQAGVLNLFRELQQRLGIAYVFIAHDLGVVRYISHWIGVMYLGEIVEISTADQLFSNPQHPYTQALLSAIPRADPQEERSRDRIVLLGDLPNPLNPPKGCKFHTRCPKAHAKCTVDKPVLRTFEEGQKVACHFPATPFG